MNPPLVAAGVSRLKIPPLPSPLWGDSQDEVLLLSDEVTTNNRPLTYFLNLEAGGGLHLYDHWHPHVDQSHQVFGVPIGQAKATVRFSPAHVLRTRRAMNSVARTIKTNPDHAHRIVWAGLKNQLPVQLAGFGGFGKDFRVEGIVGIGRDHVHVQFANGTLLHALGDAAGKVRQE